MAKELNALAFGYSGAIVSAICMLLLGILGNIGIYTGAVGMMQQWHMFFSLSIGGIIAGMIEGAVVGFIFMYLLIYFYNKLS
jgi:hypothetical protein